MAKTRIKKEDLVLVVAGKDRDLTKARRVLQVLPSEQRVLVEGANMVKRHTRPNPNKGITGGILDKEAPLHISNVALYNSASGKGERVGIRRLEDGRKVRYFKGSGEVLDA